MLATAPCTSSTGTVSAAGDALHTLPTSVARLRIWIEPDHGRRLEQRWKPAADSLVSEDRRHGDPRADPNRVSVLLQPIGQLLHTLEVDQRGRLHGAMTKPDDHVRSAHEHARAGAIPVEQAVQISERFGRVIGGGPHENKSLSQEGQEIRRLQRSSWLS